MTIGNLLGNSVYTNKGILEKLICHYCAISREQMWIQIDADLSEDIQQQIINGYMQYTQDKMPLEYIVGKVNFLGYDFAVSKDTLIPRPETEYMIQAVNEYVAGRSSMILLDIGTGCGVLGLSVLLHNPGLFSLAVLSDYSDDALSVAKKNYTTFMSAIQTPSAVTVDFLHVSLVDYIQEYKQKFTGQDVVLVANLPYIPDETFDANADDTVKKREPRMAFVGGNDGLDLYRIMFDALLNYQLQTTGFVMFLEMMTWQVDILREAYGDKMIFEEVKTFHFNIRIVKAKIIG